MRNERTLVERIVLSKTIEGELRTFDVDLHSGDKRTYEVYIYDPEEAFSADPFVLTDYEEAKALFNRCVEEIIQEPVSMTDTLYDFAERITKKLHT